MKFKNRTEAGKVLAEALRKDFFGKPDVLILALPRGGVVVGAEVARSLNLPLDLVVPRKIGAPGNPEFAIAAITETGELVWNPEAIGYQNLPAAELQAMIDAEKAEAERRLKVYRGDRAPRNVSGKICILLDDGIATGLTMQAAIQTLKKEGAQKIILAVPMAPKESIQFLSTLVDQVICLHTPLFFGAVGAFYEEFSQTSDEEVISIMNEFQT